MDSVLRAWLAAQDDPLTGARELERILSGRPHFLFIGISCGVSAPYVAGQIDWAMQQPHGTAVLMGFNPVHLARDAPVEGWTKTCRYVLPPSRCERTGRESPRTGEGTDSPTRSTETVALRVAGTSPSRWTQARTASATLCSTPSSVRHGRRA